MLHAGEDDWGASDDFRQSVMKLLGDIGTIKALKVIKSMKAKSEAYDTLRSAWYSGKVTEALWLEYCQDFDWMEPP